MSNNQKKEGDEEEDQDQETSNKEPKNVRLTDEQGEVLLTLVSDFGLRQTTIKKDPSGWNRLLLEFRKKTGVDKTVEKLFSSWGYLKKAIVKRTSEKQHITDARERKQATEKADREYTVYLEDGITVDAPKTKLNRLEYETIGEMDSLKANKVKKVELMDLAATQKKVKY
jgi:hypothetical protein